MRQLCRHEIRDDVDWEVWHRTQWGACRLHTAIIRQFRKPLIYTREIKRGVLEGSKDNQRVENLDNFLFDTPEFSPILSVAKR